MSKNNNPFKTHVKDSNGNFTTSGFTSDPKYPHGRFTSVGNSTGHYTWVRDNNGRLVNQKGSGSKSSSSTK
jgi:hypothetical protein